MSFGRASPAEMHPRNLNCDAAGISVAANIDAYKVGTPQKMVGWYLHRWEKIACGVGRSRINTAVAPTDSGKVNAFPNPYAKNNLAAERMTSSSVIPRTGRAYNSAV